MKYNKLFLIGLVVSAFGYAMENSLALTTRVEVIKGSLHEADGKVDILVVGLREQQRLNRTFKPFDGMGYRIDTVGETKFLRSNLQYINIMKKQSDSGSEGETEHHPCEIIKHRDHNFDEKRMENKVLVVVEPKLRQMGYGNKRKDYYYSKGKEEYFGEEAIQQAGKDLALCYQNVLKEGLKCLGYKENKSIAIPTLSTSTFFPRRDAAFIALATIFKFTQDNPGAYDCIQLFVKKRIEEVWYRFFFPFIEPSKDSESEESNELEEKQEEKVIVYRGGGKPTPGMLCDFLF